MADQNTVLWKDLRKFYGEAYRKKTYAQADTDVALIWKKLKKEPEFPANVLEKIRDLKKKAAEDRGRLDAYWGRVPKALPSKPLIVQDETKTKPAAGVAPQSKNISADVSSVGSNQEASRDYPTPAEDKLNKEILDLGQDVLHLIGKKDAGLANECQLKELDRKRKLLKQKEASLNNLRKNRERQRRKREGDRRIFLENPDLAKKFKRRSDIGRPKVVDDQPELLRTIVDIATHGAAAEDRRRSECLRSIKTLDALTAELNAQKFKISRSAVYLHLLPRQSNTTEGKRHVTTVPVRLKRAFNDAHKSHVDAKFCVATIRYLEELASLLGPDQVLFISQDDKARVPIGLTAANKQAPLLMHLDYRVKLPDHDWVVAERHKLIPSVYGIMQIKSKLMGKPEAVTYSGPTFISIRSGKHCSSTASSHGRDLDRLISDETFFDFTRNTDGDTKPIFIFVVDGGPDENPRYEKVVNHAIATFKKHNLDALFMATNAPGRSAFNRVERRMAPLSRELCGLILEHDHFGSHLDERGRTIDSGLERQNFEHAGKTLAELWSSMVIDGHPTKAEYVSPEESERDEMGIMTSEWKSVHVRESHYFIQIIKCQNEECCSKIRGNYFNVVPKFIPAPLCIDQSTMTASDNADLSNEFSSLLLRLRIDEQKFINVSSGEVPYDICCPSVKELISSRTCQTCGMYFASVKSVKSHKKCCQRTHSALNDEVFGQPLLTQRRHNRPVRIAARRQQERMVIWSSRLNDGHADWFDEDELVNVELEDMSLGEEVENPSITDMNTHFNVPWEDDK